MVWVLLLALLLPAAGASQQKKTAPRKGAPAKAKPALAAKPDRWPLVSLAIAGLKTYQPEQVIAVTGLRVQQPAGKADFEAARERLVATGAFETVGFRYGPEPTGKGIAATFEVVEVEPLYPVRFERLDVPAAELNAFLRRKDPLWGDQIPPTVAVLKRHTAAVEEFLASKGRPEKVRAKVVADAPEKFAVVIEPAKSEPAVAEVKFKGNQVIPTGVLMNNFAGVAFGSIYRQTSFRQMLDSSVRPLYDARGRVKVSFPEITTEPSRTADGLVVTVTVDEGPSFDLGKVEVAGAAVVPAKALLAAGAFKTGDIANFDEVNASLERMRRLLRHEGYLQPELKVERKLDDKTKVVDLVVHVEPGPQYRFGKLTIEGLDIHGEAAIQKLWTLQEGKPFNANYPEFFLEQVRERGLFDELGQTKSVVKVNEEARTADVTLIFRPSATETDAKDPVTGRRRRR